MKNFSQLSVIAFRIFRRDWRRGELLNLLFALSIAMASVSTIYLIVERLESATNQQASQVLGADLVITSPKPINSDWLEKSRQLHLTKAEVVEFASVLAANQKLQLSAVKAVSDNYPLKGKLEIADNPAGVPKKQIGAPKTGKIWVEPRILSILTAEKGTLIELGYSDLEIDGTIMLQPGQGSTLFNVAPSAIIGIKDLPATKIIQPGSRVNYRYLFIGKRRTVAEFNQWIKPQLDSSQRLVSIFDESPMAGSAITRSKNYISLSSLLTLVLLGVAIAMSASRYAVRQFDMSALMRCFGMNNRQVVTVFGLILLFTSGLGIIFGAVVGLGFQSLLINWFSELFGENLPPADLSILIYPMLISLILLFGFAMPSLLQLKSVPPMRVLRRQLTPLKASSWFIYGLAVGSLVLVMYLQMQQVKLIAIVMLGLLLMGVVFGLISKLVMSQIRRLTHSKSAAINFSLRQLDANKGMTLLHLLAFSVTIFVIALVFIVRTELLDKWQQSLASDAPNHFMVNIAANEVANIDSYLQENQVNASETYPIVRGRLVKINGVIVKQALSEKAQQHNSLKRELNMTWTNQLPKGNKLIQGQWGWPAEQRDERIEKVVNGDKKERTGKHLVTDGAISIEDKMAAALGLKIGDRLTFNIGSVNWTAKITSIRSIDWQSFTPNFYVIANPKSLQSFASTYIKAFYLPPDKKTLVAALTKLHPTAIIIELDRIFQQVQQIITKVSAAVQLIMLFVVAAGMVVLWATMEYSFSQKIRQSAILRTLGASKRFIGASFRFEFIWLAVLSSAIALLCIELVSYLLYVGLFDIEFQFHFALWWQLPMGVVVLMMLASWRGVNRITRPAPLSLLK